MKRIAFIVSLFLLSCGDEPLAKETLPMVENPREQIENQLVPIGNQLGKRLFLHEKRLLIVEQPLEFSRLNLVSATEEIRTPTPMTGATTSK